MGDSLQHASTGRRCRDGWTGRLARHEEKDTNDAGKNEQHYAHCHTGPPIRPGALALAATHLPQVVAVAVMTVMCGPAIEQLGSLQAAAAVPGAGLLSIYAILLLP